MIKQCIKQRINILNHLLSCHVPDMGSYRIFYHESGAGFDIFNWPYKNEDLPSEIKTALNDVDSALTKLLQARNSAVARLTRELAEEILKQKENAGGAGG